MKPKFRTHKCKNFEGGDAEIAHCSKCKLFDERESKTIEQGGEARKQKQDMGRKLIEARDILTLTNFCKNVSCGECPIYEKSKYCAKTEAVLKILRAIDNLNKKQGEAR